MADPGLDVVPKSIDHTLGKSVACVSTYELDPSANHQDDNTTNSNSISVENSSHDKPPGGLDQSQQWSMISVSPRSGGIEFSPQNCEGSGNMFESSSSSSPMKPPSVQSMTSPCGYDPDRIPSSVFSSGPTTPTDCWSVASNDSLFSIQMGNNSFSRDYSFMVGETKPEDWCNSPLRLNSTSESKSNLPPVSETDTPSEDDSKNADIVENDNKENMADSGDQDVHLSATSSNLSDSRRLSSSDASRQSMNPPRGSNASTGSCSSFAFPLLGENGRSGRSSSQRTMSVTQASTEEEPEPEPEPEQEPKQSPVPETQTQTQNQELEPATKCNWFSCRMCWPRCCFKLC